MELKLNSKYTWLNFLIIKLFYKKHMFWDAVYYLILFKWHFASSNYIHREVKLKLTYRYTRPRLHDLGRIKSALACANGSSATTAATCQDGSGVNATPQCSPGGANPKSCQAGKAAGASFPTGTLTANCNAGGNAIGTGQGTQAGCSVGNVIT